MEIEKDFIEISFPQEIASHLGWRDMNRMLNRKDELEREADDIVDQLTILVTTNNAKIWLFYGSDADIGVILKEKLDTSFSFTAERDLQGSFYNKILIYQK